MNNCPYLAPPSEKATYRRLLLIIHDCRRGISPQHDMCKQSADAVAHDVKY